MSNFAFVIGAARSGTTAMAELLNRHPRVCIGVERYKYTKSLSPALFEEERFFTFDDAETNVLPSKSERWAQIYSEMREKWAGAALVGDKLAGRLLPRVLKAFPDARIVYMLRDIDGVAASWNARARKGVGKWPEGNDFRVAVPAWNHANALALGAMASRPSSMVVVEYERFFSGGSAEARRLAELIGVDASAEFLAAHRSFAEHYQTAVADKPREPKPGQDDFIREHADMDRYERLRQVARSQFGG